MSETESATVDLSALTSDIVSAYVSKNNVPSAELPALIRSIYDVLSNIGRPAAPANDEIAKASPSQIRKSITHDHLVSFLDGKNYKSLKRHLTKHGLTPEEYRTKFGLPRDYPMVAESYAKQRSELARTLGLGQIRRDRAARARALAEAPGLPAEAPAAEAADSSAKRPARRARSTKAAAE
ncbi:MucR family transcriptional regulator [Methylobacterium sp. JK268]